MLQLGILVPIILFPFVKPGSKNGKVFPSDGSYVTLYDFLNPGFFIGWLQQASSNIHLVRKQTFNHYAKLGFPICLQANAKFRCCLN